MLVTSRRLLELPQAIPAHWPTLNLGHVDISQSKDAQCLEQLAGSLLEAEHNAGLEGLGLTLTLTSQQRLPVSSTQAGEDGLQILEFVSMQSTKFQIC